MATSLLIFLDCEAHFNELVKPLFIANAMKQYTKKKMTPRLVKNRDKGNDYDVFVGEALRS